MVTKSKDTAAKDSNTVGEGDDVKTFAVADPKGKWYVAKGYYPLIDPESGTRFEAGTPTRATLTRWVQTQIDNHAMAEVDAPEDATGKLASQVDDSVNETPPNPDEQAGSMANGMQSGVAGS